jgi:hypothetical protein
MQAACSQCTFSTVIDAALLPEAGMEGVCPGCGSIIPLAGSGGAGQPEDEAPPEPVAATPYHEDEGRVSLINIIVLLFIVDSTLSLFGRLPGIGEVLGGENSGLTFHQRAKYLYDTLSAVGFFICCFGLMARRNWARVGLVWLLGLGLAEGVYMLAYSYFAVSDLEANLNEGFREMRVHQNAKAVGCLIYAFFMAKLQSPAVRSRFR